MELVYLWVEDYKNIKRLGFNFSPRFECEYDEITKELTIDENEDYLENFFGENINITAIVGENGSGKSSLTYQNMYNMKSFKIIYENDILNIYKSIYIEEISNQVTIINNTKYKDWTILDDKPEINVTGINDKGKAITEDDILKDKHMYNSQDSIYFNWDIINFNDYEEYIEEYLYNSTRYNPSILIPMLIENTEKQDINYKFFQKKIIKKIINFYFKFSTKEFLFNPATISINYEALKIKEHDTAERKEISNLIRHESTGTYWNDISLNNFYKNIYAGREELFNNLIDKNEIKVNISDQKKRNIFDLSHGERSLFILMLLVYLEALDKDKNLIIYLDEPDSTLHPQWQKKFLSHLVNVFSDFTHKIHFIITSHSPFILSDLPKENVIFLKNGKQDKSVDINPFGANIHTLLSHGFFMQDGLMGEFAKEKINDVYKFLSDKNYAGDMNKDKAEQIIKIIGEPVLQKELQKLFDKNTHTNIDERIKAHENEIARLKAQKDKQ